MRSVTDPHDVFAYGYDMGYDDGAFSGFLVGVVVGGLITFCAVLLVTWWLA